MGGKQRSPPVPLLKEFNRQPKLYLGYVYLSFESGLEVKKQKNVLGLNIQTWYNGKPDCHLQAGKQ